MADLRIGYVGSARANLDWSELSERPIDRVAAAGLCSPIGILLWKAKYGAEAMAYQELSKQLLKKYWDIYSDRREIAERIVEQALHEVIAGQCLTCRGAKQILADELLVPCPGCKLPGCESSGIRGFSDIERARSMKLSYGLVKRLSHKICRLVDFLTTEDKLVNYQISQQLERS